MSLRRALQLALATVIVVAAASFGSAAGAVDDPSYSGGPPTTFTSDPPSEIKTVSVGTGSGAAAAGTNNASAVAGRQRLAITGADSGQLALYGALLLIGGATLLVLRRSDHA